MKKVNTTLILILIFLLVFSIGSKQKIEYTKWEYATYWRVNMVPGPNIWKTPYSSTWGVGLEKLCKKLNIDKGKRTEYLKIDLFNYAGAQGWEFIAINYDIDTDLTTYWFKRPKRG